MGKDMTLEEFKKYTEDQKTRCLAEQRDTITQLCRIVEEYGEHKKRCAHFTFHEYPVCTCGLTDAYVKVKKEAE